MLKYKRYARILFPVLFILVFAILGVLYTNYSWHKIENERIEIILQLCKSIEATFPKVEINKLDASPNDIDKSQYLVIKNILKEIISINKNARFAYLYTRKDGKLYFIADSEPEDSKDYSPPGQEYTEAPLAYYQPFIDGKTLVTGSVSDRWGTWRSALIPIKENSNSRTTAVFAMDFNAASLKNAILYEVIKSGLLATLLIIVIFVSIKIKSKNIKFKNEIIQRKLAEQTLIENKELYRLLADKMTDVIWLMDLKGKSLYVSPSITQFTGFSVEEYLQQKIDDRFTKESANNAKQILMNESSQLSTSYENLKEFRLTQQLEYICKNNQTKWGELIITPYFGDNNQLIGVHGVTRDITKRKLAEENLNNSLALMDATIELTDNGILVVNSKGGVVKANSRFIEMWSIPQELIAEANDQKLIDSILEQLVNPDTFLVKVKQLYNEPYSGSFDIVCFKDGREFERISKPMLVDGKPKGRVWSFNDITKHKQIIESLKQSEERFRSVSQTANDAIITANCSGMIIEWNNGAEKIFGYNESEIIGQPLTVIIPQNFTHQHIEGIKRIEQGGEKHVMGRTVELFGLKKNGVIFPIELSLSEWESSEGKFFTGIIRDITERKQIEKDIQMLANAMKSINECVSITDIDNKLLFVNESFLKTYGYTEDELIGKNMELIRSSNNKVEIVSQILRSTLLGGWDGELLNIRKNGSEFPIHLSTSVIHDKDSKPIALIGVSSDITELKLAEKHRKQAARENKMLANAMKSINECVSITDMEDKILFVNDSFLKTYGYTEDELIGKNVAIVHSPNTPMEIVERILPSTLSGRWDGELLNIKKDGSEFPIFLSTSVIHDSDAKPIALIGVSLDITERKKAEELLRQSEVRYRTLVDNVGEGIGFVDPNEVFVFANPVSETIFGVNKGGLAGRNLKEFISEEQYASVRNQTQARQEGKKNSYEIEFTRSDGEIRNLLISAVPQFDDNGVFVGAYGVFRDITNRKQADAVIQQQNKELKALNNTKDKFFSIIAHDLKSPFNTLLGLTELLAENLHVYDINTTETIVESLNSTTQQTYKLLENLLDWSRNQQNRIDFNPIKNDISSISAEIISLLKPTADKKNISLILETKAPNFASADTYMVNAVIRNLISNAIKFTRENGSIKINTKKQDSMVLISISDNGVGIKPDNVNKLFRIDTNISQQGTSGEKGTGLGLILCKEFVEKHGGNIWVKSEVGIGSTFYFTLKQVNDKFM